MASDLDPIFNAAGAEWNVDPNLLRAIAGQESGGTADPNRAVSPRGALGMMQIMSPTAQELGVADTSDPRQSIYGAAKYLSQHLDKYGKPELALAAYNAGPGRVDAFLAGKGQLPAETQAYIPGVTAKYLKLTAAAPQAAPAAQQSAAADPFTAALQDAQKAAVSAPMAAPVAASTAEADPFTAALQEAQKATGNAPATPSQARSYGPLAQDVADQQLEAARAQDAAKPFDQNLREAIAPAPNTQYGTVLPIARDTQTGAIRMALPSSLRDILAGGVDLVEGPSTGTVTPAATNALLAGATGGMSRSVAADTGAAIANRLLPSSSAALGRNEAPDLLGAQFRAAPAMDGATVTSGDSVTAIPTALTDRIANRLTGSASPQPPQLIPPAQDDLQAAQAASGPSAGMGGPMPNSVGAAASSSTEAHLTPAQIQAYRSTAEGQKLLEPQGQGRDLNAYVPGVRPNSAEIEQNVNIARELKILGQASPTVSQEAKDIAVSNNDARMNHFAQIAGSPVDVQNAIAARSAQAEQDLAATWQNKTEADPTPVFATAEDILKSPDGRRPVVRQAINSVVSEMRDADGNPITDPEMLYGVRKHIDDLMSKEASASDPKSVRAQASLQSLKSDLDATIEAAAPGFRQYLNNFSEASRPIDAMNALQGFEKKLVDTKNNMQYSRVQNMMRQIVDSRAAPGINEFKSIPDDTMNQLWALRDDLRRSATAQDLAKAPGSDTAQNLMDLARLGGNAALHAGANAIAPGIGSIAISGVKTAFAPVLAARAARQQTARGLNLLRPETELQNRLLDPP